MVGLQIYDTLGVVTTRFFDAEHTALAAGKFQANPKDTVSTGKPLGFTGCSLATDSDEVVLIQKAQGKKIEVVDLTAADRAQKYVENRGAAHISLQSVSRKLHSTFLPPHKCNSRQIQTTRG
jgi:hypothetical protein